VLRLLVGLVDKSMLEVTRQSGEISYRMLTTIQHYTQMKLASQPNARSIVTAHSNWAIALAEAANIALQAFLVESGDHRGFLSARALREESSWVERLLDAGKVPDDVLDSVLSAQGFLLVLQNNLTEAIPILERCLDLCAAAADDEGSAKAKLFLATAM
jgi:hypothetical protein